MIRLVSFHQLWSQKKVQQLWYLISVAKILGMIFSFLDAILHFDSFPSGILEFPLTTSITKTLYKSQNLFLLSTLFYISIILQPFLLPYKVVISRSQQNQPPCLKQGSEQGSEKVSSTPYGNWNPSWEELE